MLEKLDFMVRYWQLRARHGALGAPLSRLEQVELLSLLRLMSTDTRLPDPGQLRRDDTGLPVQLTAPGGFISGDLRLVCADGLVVACARSLRPGQSCILRLADAVSGVEYAVPCVVEWTHTGSPSAMALRVDGAPTRVSFSIPQPGMWRSPLGLTERPWSPAE
jgi:hypothetical protein